MLKQYLGINDACGITITLLPGGEYDLGFCTLEAKGNQLDIKKKVTSIKQLDGLPRLVSTAIPLSVNLAGKGILIKQTERVEQLDKSTFSKVLPNANIDDFYVQHFTSGSASFLSLIRKTEADKWLQQLSGLGYTVLLLSLGPFAVEQVLPQVNMYGNEIVFDGHQIERSDAGEWTGYHNTASAIATFPLKIESEKIEEKLLLAYAAAFQLILARRLSLIHVEAPQLDAALNFAITNKKVQVLSYAALGLLFIMLLVNFVLFSYYGSQNLAQAAVVSKTAQSTLDINEINQRIRQQKNILDSLGWDGGINKSVLIDQLAQLLPPEVTLQQLALNPVDVARNGEQKAIKFLGHTIEVAGTSEKITSINEWVGRVKSLKWAKGARLQSYSYSNEINTGQFIVVVDY